jgi:hypothetical protein
MFSIDIPIKGSQSHSNVRSKVTVVSYLHSGVNDTAVHITSVSMTPLCMSQRCQWLRCACHSVANDSAVHVSAVTMTLLCNQLCRFTPQIWSHIQKGFNPCIRGLGGVVWWKKQRSKISCQGPFKNLIYGRKSSTCAQSHSSNSSNYLTELN